ncbi:MAG TPA: cation diffusion facilitator family transporter, partial [Bacteroidia bacterium]|nr:cation diffusion facilitator family transporter [Bacteroidia bacterium]
AEVRAMEDLISKQTIEEIEFFIHADPCIPSSCPVCNVKDCPQRKAAFVKTIAWSKDNMLPDAKHTLQS